MQRVFVTDTKNRTLTPCRPKRARELLKQGKAAVFRRFPFTIILKHEVPDASPMPLRVKIDPGSKKTGLAIVNDISGEVVFAAEIEHRGQRVRDSLESRRAIRRSRRNRNTRYRKPRFMNRTRKKGWLPPSLESRIANVETWIRRLIKISPIQAISQELVRFDTQKMENPEISGVEYQQGTLAGYECREYLLEKWRRTCAYCGKKDVPLEIEHINPRSSGGSDRISNLTLSCRSCNEKKGNKPVEDFLKKKPEVLKKIKAQAKAPLKDAAAVNATRWALFGRLKSFGCPVEAGSGGLTKFNRIQRSLSKTHWADAACVGLSTPETLKTDGIGSLQIRAMGFGTRQICQTDKYGFPIRHRTGQKSFFGFQTGDMVKAFITKGKNAGIYSGRITVRASGIFHMPVEGRTRLELSHKYCKVIQKADGYRYAV